MVSSWTIFTQRPFNGGRSSWTQIANQRFSASVQLHRAVEDLARSMGHPSSDGLSSNDARWEDNTVLNLPLSTVFQGQCAMSSSSIISGHVKRSRSKRDSMTICLLPLLSSQTTLPGFWVGDLLMETVCKIVWCTWSKNCNPVNLEFCCSEQLDQPDFSTQSFIDVCSRLWSLVRLLPLLHHQSHGPVDESMKHAHGTALPILALLEICSVYHTVSMNSHRSAERWCCRWAHSKGLAPCFKEKHWQK